MWKDQISKYDNSPFLCAEWALCSNRSANVAFQSVNVCERKPSYIKKEKSKALPNNLVNSKSCDWMANVSHNQQEFALTLALVCTVKELNFLCVQSEYLITLHHLKTTTPCKVLLSPKCSVTSKY